MKKTIIFLSCFAFASAVYGVEHEKELEKLSPEITSAIQKLPAELKSTVGEGALRLKQQEVSDQEITKIIEHIADTPRRLKCGKPYCFY